MPYLVFAVLLLAELGAILFLNHGSLVYSLDDAYIHLALAGRIWTGTYGINAHEFAAPASSILWPFLLAPFSVLPTPVFTAVPFVINVIAASTSLMLIVREVSRSLGLYAPPAAAAPGTASTPISPTVPLGGSAGTAAKLSAGTRATPAGLATGMSPPLAKALPPSHPASATYATSTPRAQSGTTLAAMLFASGLVLATNLVPIIFTGMEHSLQQMLAVMIIVGLIEEARTGRAPRMLWIALLVLPLVRYDSLALAVPALLYLAWRRHWRGFASVAAVIAVTCGGFSLFLMAHGLGIMPASVMAKSEVLRSGGGGSSSHFAVLTTLVANVYGNLIANPQGNVMLGGLALVLAPALDRRRPLQERAFALVPGVALALEFVVGKFGAYFRYEAYVWTATLVALVYLYRDALKKILSPEGLLAPQVGLLGGLAAASVSYLYTLATTPIASNNIYDQQYQMHRFVSEYYHAPVAVNDLGWVAFRNSNYVLDLAGLASKEALTARLHEPGSTWMERLCREHDVRFAMIYDAWFPDRPAEWVRVGTLKFAQLRVTAASAAVQFYATDSAEVPVLRAALLAFQTSLPNGVSFHFEPAPQNSM